MTPRALLLYIAVLAALGVGASVGVGFSDDGFDDAATLVRRAHEPLRRRRLRRHLGVDGF